MLYMNSLRLFSFQCVSNLAQVHPDPITRTELDEEPLPPVIVLPLPSASSMQKQKLKNIINSNKCIVENNFNSKLKSESSSPSSSSSSFIVVIQKILPGIFTFCMLSCTLLLVPWILFATVHAEICQSSECETASKLLQRTMDTAVDPCEDFYQYSCGHWNWSSSSLSYLDHTTLIRQRILEKLRELTEEIGTTGVDGKTLETEPSSIIEMKTFYDSCVKRNSSITKNEATSSRMESVASVINNLVPPNSSLGITLGSIRRLTGQNFIIKLSIGPDFKNPRKNRIFIERPELALPKQILHSSGSFGEEYALLIFSSLSKVWPLLYRDVPSKEINETVRQILEIEVELAQAMTTDDERTKPEMFNLVSLGQINDLFLKRQELEDPQLEMGVRETQVKLNWTEYVRAVFVNVTRKTIGEETIVNVKDVQYLRRLAAVISKTSVPRLRNYLRWQLLNTFGNNFLQDQQPHERHQGDGKNSGSNSTILVVDEKEVIGRQFECIQLMDTLIPFALSYKYVVNNVTKPKVIPEAEAMLRDVVSSFQDMVARSSWMESGTKLKAIKKAGTVRAFLGYPKWLGNSTALDTYFRGLEFYPGDFLRNLLVALEWTSIKDLASYNQPVDTQWSGTGDSPMEVDAFYNDELNSITIPLGFLQMPFVGMGLRSLDYGALGFFIGHELIHGFDTEGRYSDELGRLSSWWTPRTLENFNMKTHCIEEQYSHFYIPKINAKVNGKQTLKENIADNGGLKQAFRAYHLYTQRNGPEKLSLPGMERFSPEQLFFLSFAQSWCSYVSEPTLRDMVQFNEHSPPKFRVLGALSNLRNFSTVWNCSVGSRMNRKNKCFLW